MSDSLWTHGLQHARPPCPSPTPRVYSNSCPLSQWCHTTISSSVIPFSSSLQSFPASGSFQSQFFTSGGQSIGVSTSTSVLSMNIQDWFPLGWTGWISLQSKGLSRVFSNTTLQKHQFFSAQLSSQSNSHSHTWPVEKPQPWLDGPLLAKGCCNKSAAHHAAPTAGVSRLDSSRGRNPRSKRDQSHVPSEGPREGSVPGLSRSLTVVLWFGH